MLDIYFFLILRLDYIKILIILLDFIKILIFLEVMLLNIFWGFRYDFLLSLTKTS